MVTLASLRADAVAALTAAGFKAEDYVAERVTPPCVVVVPGEPYLTEPDGQTVPFGHLTVHLDVLVVAGRGTNRATAAWLDDAIPRVIDALDDLDVTAVSAPSEVTTNGNSHMGVVVTTSTLARLG